MKKRTKNASLSIVIVTKNRKALLQSCLSSLVFQTQPPSEIIVVDNGSDDGTVGLVNSFSQQVKIPIYLIQDKRLGYPFIYNTGLKKAQSRWVGVIDDDCLVDNQWVESMMRVINKYPDSSAILGATETQKTQNTFSLLTHIFDRYWKENGVIRNRVIDFEILDNKNIVYNKKFLTTHAIAFDEARATQFLGAGEDSDVGRQIEKVDGKAYFNRHAIVQHKDPDNLIWFIKKYLSSYAGYLYFREKWKNTLVYRTNQKKLLMIFFEITKKYQLNIFKKNLLFIVLIFFTVLSFILTKLQRFTFIKRQILQLRNPNLQVSL